MSVRSSFALALLALLCLAGPAWGQTYDSMGYWKTSGATTINLTADGPVWTIVGSDTTKLTFTAGATDSIMEYGVYTDINAPIEVGAYTWSSNPVSRVHTASVTTSATLQWHTVVLGTKFGLTNGQTYCVGASAGSSQAGFLYRNGNPMPDFGIGETTTGGALPATYNANENTWNGRMLVYAKIQRGSASAPTLVLGAVTVGAGTVGGK